MLSIEQCRVFIPDCNLIDKQMVNLRDNLYELAELALDAYFEGKIKKNDAERGEVNYNRNI